MRRCWYVARSFTAAGIEHEDLAQEAALGAVAARRDWRPERGPFDPFEWACMRHMVQHAVRAARRWKRGGLVVTVPLPGYLPQPDTPETVAAAHEFAGQLRRLPEREQRTLLLRAAGWTDVEIGTREGLTRSGVHDRIARARGDLRRCL